MLFCVAVFFLLANYSPKPKNDFEVLNDGCLVYALYYKNSLLAQEMLGDTMWARVLAIHFYGQLGHAITVFVYENNTYIYDPNRGSFIAAAYPIYDPLTLAEIAFPKLRIKKAHYLEPTMLLHYNYNQKKDPFRINL